MGKKAHNDLGKTSIDLGKTSIGLEKTSIGLETMINVLQEAVIICERTHKISLMNRNACRIFETSVTEYEGKMLSDYITNEETITGVEELWGQYPAGDWGALPVVLNEIKVTGKNGREKILVVSAAPIIIEGTSYTFLALRDLTVLKNAFLRIDNNKKQYELLAEHSPLGIISCDQTGAIEYMNQRMAMILEIDLSFLDQELNIYNNERIRIAGLEEKVQECISKNVESTMISPFLSPSRKNLELRILIKPIVMSDSITGALLLIEDYTIRYQLEEEQKKKEERLYMMLRGIPHPAWLVSKSFLIIAQNSTAEKMFGREVGDFCWDESIALEKSFLYRHGKELRTESINDEIEMDGLVWDTWWIPLGEDIYLYYATNITKYKMIEEELFSLSTTDALTGIYNRRFFEKKMEEEMERVYRGSHSFSLIMIDIDHFKQVNDSYGHSTGDKVLKELATEILRNRIRKIDFLARWGGEEFMLLLPETSLSKALLLAEELRGSINCICFREVGNITASFGVAMFSVGDTKESVLENVDKALYQAKADGRNCVRSIGEIK